jgi:competence protein ComEC
VDHASDCSECFGNILSRLWLLLFSSLFLGLSSLGIQFSSARPIGLDDSITDFQTVFAEFHLLDEARKFGGSGSFRANIRITSAGIFGEQKSFNARGELRGSEELKELAPSAKYSCWLTLRPSKDSDRAGFLSRCNDSPVGISPAPAGKSIVQNLRDSFLESSRGVTQDSRGLVAGLAIGDTSMLSEATLQNMKSVSLTHLTAVSGANCAIVLGLVYFLVIRAGGGRWARLIAGLVTLFAYVALVGAQPSVLRAAVMAGAVLVAIAIGRKAAALDALALSVIFLLIADPWLSTDFGFALSVAATAGLLLLTEPLSRKLALHLPNWAAISIAIAVSAQIFCLPILLQLQNGLSTYALPANLLAEPVVAPITVLGILALVFAVPFPWLASQLSFVASIGTFYISKLAEYFASLPNESLTWPVGALGTAAAIAVILGFVLWLRSSSMSSKNLGLMLLSMILAVSVGSISFIQIRSASWPMADWQIIACDVGQGDAMVIRSSSLIALIDVGRDDKPIDECLDRLDVKQIDFLVLTHFDMDHVGGIKGALAGRRVSTVLISPFKDERWGATGTNLYLQKTGARVILAERGLSGQFGNFSWQVLSPEHSAAGTEDSNDASVVMLWSSNYLNLITMADIGEKGQMRMVANSDWWRSPELTSKPLVLKVSHHGSADQYPELIEELDPDLGLISVGSNNSYGHPTSRTLSVLARAGSRVARTDQMGSIAVSAGASGLILANSPRLTG